MVNAADYTATAEKSAFNDGFRPKIVEDADGHTAYLGSKTFDTAEQAADYAHDVLHGKYSGFRY